MTEADQNKASKLAEDVKTLRQRRLDPATPKGERRRIKLQIETYTWMMERLDPERYGKTLRITQNNQLKSMGNQNGR